MAYYENKEKGLYLNVNIGQLASGNILKDHIVFITGAAGGIGSAIAKKCVNQGAKVVLADKDIVRLKELENELGNNSRAICFDIREISKFGAILKRADLYFGNIDCLINNAGISLHEGDFMNVTEDSWDQQFDINLKSAFFLTQAWVRYYRCKKMMSGRIIMMASDTSGMGSSVPYGLSKAGVSSLTCGLAKKLITEEIRINALAPGMTLTPMTRDYTHGEVCRTTTQGKRSLFPEEIAEICIFLLSDMSACISGNIFGCSEANICFDNICREQETNP